MNGVNRRIPIQNPSFQKRNGALIRCDGRREKGEGLGTIVTRSDKVSNVNEGGGKKKSRSKPKGVGGDRDGENSVQSKES